MIVRSVETTKRFTSTAGNLPTISFCMGRSSPSQTSIASRTTCKPDPSPPLMIARNNCGVARTCENNARQSTRNGEPGLVLSIGIITRFAWAFSKSSFSEMCVECRPADGRLSCDVAYAEIPVGAMKEQFYECLINLVSRSPDPCIRNGIGVIAGKFRDTLRFMFHNGLLCAISVERRLALAE